LRASSQLLPIRPDPNRPRTEECGLRADSNKPPKAQPTILNQANDMIGPTSQRSSLKYMTDISCQIFERRVMALQESNVRLSSKAEPY
jgi:hypothetical protein